MKTAEERAKELASKVIDLGCTDDKDCEELIEEIVRFAKEQDKITRHAAIDEVYNLEQVKSPLGRPAVLLNEVEKAIMNTKAV